MNFILNLFYIVIINKISIQHMWMFVYIVINEFYLLCWIFYLLSYVPEIFFLSYSFVMFRIDFLLSIWVNLHVYIDIVFVGLVFGLKFLLIIVLYYTWQIKHLYFFGAKSKLQPMSSSLGFDKFLFGILYINLLNLVWFWSRICWFYKFWNFKSWDFWYLCLSKLILILHLKCFLFRFMWFFVFLLKVMIFGWLIICLD